MSNLRIPYGWCMLICLVFVLLTGWAMHLAAYSFALIFAVAVIIFFCISLLGFMNSGGDKNDTC